MKDMTFLSVAFEKPHDVLTDDPMQIKKSAIPSGGKNPKV